METKDSDRWTSECKVPPAGLPLGSLNPLKSVFKHLVPNVSNSQKVVPKVPIFVQLAIFQLILIKFFYLKCTRHLHTRHMQAIQGAAKKWTP